MLDDWSGGKAALSLAFILAGSAPHARFFAFLHLPRMMLLPSATMLWHRPGNGKASEKQVAMIAQKVVDAKHAQEQRRRFVTAPDA